MKIQLSDHFTVKKLIRFVMPTVFMMIFVSIYGVVDGFFVSNFLGKDAFTAVNLIMPIPMILGALGFLFGTGGSALVAKTMGEQKQEKANQIFSLLMYIGIGSGITLGLLGILFLRPITYLLGAEGEVAELCIDYARILLITLPAFLLQNMFQSFLVTAEKPTFGLIITIAAGVSNILLDMLFIMVFDWGIVGAAAASGISQLIGGLVPLAYFASKTSKPLHLGKAVWDGKALLHTITNGCSEFVSNIAISVVAVLYNLQLMKYAGDNGVAAYGVIMYASFIFIAIFLGYSIGVAPIIGYHYGAGNTDELKNLFRKSMIFENGMGVILTVVSFFLARPLAQFFVGYDAELCDLTTHALQVYAFSFLFCGVGLFGSAMFTALNNGLISAAISFSQTMIFPALAIIIMPAIWGIEGIWSAIIVTNFIATVVALLLMAKYRKKYQY